MEQKFEFTISELRNLLQDTLELFEEHQDVHGFDEVSAKYKAIDNQIDGILARQQAPLTLMDHMMQRAPAKE